MMEFVLPDRDKSLIKTDDVRLACDKNNKITAVLLSQNAAWVDEIDANTLPHIEIGQTPLKKGRKFFGIGNIHKHHLKVLDADVTDENAIHGLAVVAQVMREVRELQDAFDSGDIAVYTPEHN